MSDSGQSFYEESPFVKIFEGVGSIGAIFVSPTYEARDVAVLKEKQINAVLTAEKQQKISLPSSQVHAYLYLQIQDDINFNIAEFFEESFKFIEQNRRLTNILIHCSTGLNCSISIVMAYLIKKYQYTYQQALTLVKRRYRQFNVNEFNPGFVHRLEYFAVQKGDFKSVKENHMRKRIQRVRRTVDGIVRTYSKQLSTQQKLLGCKSPSKYLNKTSKSLLSIRSMGSSIFLPCQSVRKIQIKNPEEATQSSYQLNDEYSKYLPKKTQQEIQDDEHHRKIVSQMFLLSEQSKIFQSKRIDHLNSDVNAMKNYERLGKSKKNHLTFYSPLKKYEKYQMFTQNKLNFQFEALINSDL